MRSIAPWRAAAASAALAVGMAAAAGCSSPPGSVADGSAPDGGGSGGGGSGGGAPDAPIADTAAETAQCAVMVQSHADEGALHIACTSPATYLTNPPSSGNHYPRWPNAGAYTSTIPWGNLVHFMEHGGVVIAYNCSVGNCNDEIARAQAFVASVSDPDCTPARVILMPDTGLDVRWAAAAWTWTLRAPCFDQAAFSQFVTDHIGRALESVCSGYAVADLCPPP